MLFRRGVSPQRCVLIVCVLWAISAQAEDPKPTPENTIHVQLAEAVKPQTFSRPLKFFLVDVVDRSGSAQPMMVFKPRGGIFLDHTPSEITRVGLESCLKSADMLAKDRESADFLLTVYLFKFGLSEGSGMDFFGKVEFAVIVKNPKTAKSQQISASGTSIIGAAVRKKNIQKNVQEDIERAFGDALRNLLRGMKLRDAISTLDVPADLSGTPAQAPATAAPAAAEKPPRDWVTDKKASYRRKTMKLMLLALAVLLVWTAPAIAKDPQQQFKSVEAKHFPRAEGVELSPAFSDYLYAELRAELTKAKFFGQVIGEDEVVDAADAPKSLIIVGTITEFKKGSVVKDALIGFGAGKRSLKVDANAARRSDQQNLSAIHVHVRVSPRWNEKVMARYAAKNIVKQLKDSLKSEAKATS